MTIIKNGAGVVAPTPLPQPQGVVASLIVSGNRAQLDGGRGYFFPSLVFMIRIMRLISATTKLIAANMTENNVKTSIIRLHPLSGLSHHRAPCICSACTITCLYIFWQPDKRLRLIGKTN